MEGAQPTAGPSRQRADGDSGSGEARQLPHIMSLYCPGQTGPGASPAERSTPCGLCYSDRAQGQ